MIKALILSIICIYPVLMFIVFHSRIKSIKDVYALFFLLKVGNLSIINIVEIVLMLFVLLEAIVNLSGNYNNIFRIKSMRRITLDLLINFVLIAITIFLDKFNAIFGIIILFLSLIIVIFYVTLTIKQFDKKYINDMEIV